MLARGLAHIAVRRPGLLIAAALLLLLAAIFLFQSRQSFDSEILNLLPSDAASVRGLKIYNSRFNSARELAFLVETPAGADPGLADDFVEALGRQPWVLRILDASPMESQKGWETLPALAAPLILGQSDEDFDKSVEKLEPHALSSRLQSLASKARAGSPLARMELMNDPTGLIAPVAGMLSEKLSIAENVDLVAPDGQARLVPVIAKMPGLSAGDCRDLMQKVHSFVEEFRRRPGAPLVSVTGRSAYVDEISQTMHRDIALTGLVSISAVTLLFWFSFRSLVPLAGSVLILAWTCLISLACGSLLFDKLNVVAMGFCSILVGLGDDFSLLLYQRYVGARASGMTREEAIADSTRHSVPGILWVALTTGLGFASLLFSGSAGFAQLGVLIAIGVLACAGGVIFFMPLFERKVPANDGDPVRKFCSRLIHSRWTFRLGGGLLSGALLLAMIPWRTLEFDTSTHSLEPREIPAAKALSRIMEIFPATFEPLMIVVPGPPDYQSLVELDGKLAALQQNGLVERFSSPLALVQNPAQIKRNLARFQALDWEGLERSVTEAGRSAGLRPGALDSATRLLTGLQSQRPLAEQLPPLSPWWFVLDRMLAPSSGDVIYYVRLPAGSDRVARQRLETAVVDILPSALVTGWSQMLNDLVSWAVRELLIFGGAVIGIILVILFSIYRHPGVLALHMGTLFLAMCGTAATLKISGHAINLLSVLAFPLILAVGVDYGVHLILAAREKGDIGTNLPAVMKPVLISALTTITGFGALTLAQNPALTGLGFVCATGVAWCLAASFLFLAPLCGRCCRCSRPL
ncbi:MAG: MMPL family transporter [Terrimicrobiaceae bacterium]